MPESDVPILNEDWAARNYLRVRVLMGFLMLTMSGLALSADAYTAAVLYGVVGGLFVGGWPALRRLLLDPRRWQLKQWFYILIDARKTMEHPGIDGRTREVVMRPTLHGWREARHR